MSSGSRKPHTKSRNGCGQCRKRKVKCNEQAPKCSNCTKWKKQCDFEVFGHPIKLSPCVKKLSGQTSSEKIEGQMIPSPAAIPVPSNMNLSQLELMHHYLTTTSGTIHDIGDDARWKIVVPSQALSHGFLLHALLGVSALHINHLRGATDANAQYLTYAKSHHEQAHMPFRSTVTEITKVNCTAASTFSCLMLIFSCGMAQSFRPSKPEETVDGILTILASFRCHWRLFISAKQWIESGPLRGFPPFRTSSSPTTGDDAAMKALVELLAINSAFTEDKREKAVYHETSVHLSKPLNGSIAFSRTLWLVFTSDEYLSLLEQKRPMALVILAHGSAIAKYGPVRWFANDLHLNMTCAIARVIDPEWRPSMKWPLEEWGLIYDGAGNCILDQSRS